ncbi:MAG TPA: VOC family protein [Gemmatimonadaceae bacterium]|nr:VOC family protein [Gemmatimonadaceae bacterium]
MKAHLDVVTLAVRDLDRAVAFYRDGLGLPTKGIVATELPATERDAAGAVAFFEMDGGLMLAVYPRQELVRDAAVPNSPPSAVEFSLGYVAESKSAVDDLIARAVTAGASRTEPARKRPWGIYSGYVRDPDGHLWEIIWNAKGEAASA